MRANAALCAFQLRASSEIQLAPVGEFRGLDGRPKEVAAWRINAAIAAKVIARANARATRFVIDYEHQTLMTEQNAQPAPAAGWFKHLEWREGSGLFSTDVEWTERAKAMIEAGEYLYISPVFRYSAETGDVLEIVMASLVNTPNLDGMAEVALRAAARFGQEEITRAQLAVCRLLGVKPEDYLRQLRGAPASRLTAGQLAVCRLLGVKPEDYTKHLLEHD